MNLSQRISDLVDAGSDNKEIVRIIGCHVATVNKVQALKRSGQSLSPVKPPGRPAVKTAPAALRRLKVAIKGHPRRSLREHARNLDLSQSSVGRGAQKLGAKSRIRQRKPLLTPEH